MPEIKRILIISLSGVGDTFFATSFIKELKKLYPDSKIDDLVLWKASAQLLEKNQDINEVLYDNLESKNRIKMLFFFFSLRKRKYDISFNVYPQSRVEYRIVSWIIGAKKRFSHWYRNCCIFDKFFITDFINENKEIHCSLNNLNFINYLNGKKINDTLIHKDLNLNIDLYKEHLDWGSQFLASNNLFGKEIVGIHVGSGRTKNLELRRWPTEKYISLIIKLLENHQNLSVIIFGGKEEKINDEYIYREVLKFNDEYKNRIFLCEPENILFTASVIKNCDVFLSVDTSLMHIAGALKVKKQIIIETPTFDQTVYPMNNFIIIKNPELEKFRFFRTVKKTGDIYSYDGKPIKASNSELKKIMNSVTVESVLEKMI